MTSQRPKDKRKSGKVNQEVIQRKMYVLPREISQAVSP